MERRGFGDKESNSESQERNSAFRLLTIRATRSKAVWARATSRAAPSGTTADPDRIELAICRIRAKVSVKLGSYHCCCKDAAAAGATDITSCVETCNTEIGVAVRTGRKCENHSQPHWQHGAKMKLQLTPIILISDSNRLMLCCSTSTASAEVTHPEQARQSFSET